MLLETDVSSDVHPQLSMFLTGLRKGAQALTYLDLRKMWNSLPFPYRQVGRFFGLLGLNLFLLFFCFCEPLLSGCVIPWDFCRRCISFFL